MRCEETLSGIGERLAGSVDSAVIGRDEAIASRDLAAAANPATPAAAASPVVISLRREMFVMGAPWVRPRVL